MNILQGRTNTFVNHGLRVYLHAGWSDITYHFDALEDMIGVS